MAEPLVLALDGSTRVCSAALVSTRRQVAGAAGQVWRSTWEAVAERTEVDDRGQAKVLLRMVDEMLQETGNQPGDLDAIVVGVGPGTFTGVRIAVATARALSLALAIPVAGVSTLGGLASAAAVALDGVTGSCAASRLLVPVVDARRSQLFYGLYEREADGTRGTGTWKRSVPFAVCDRGALSEVLAGRAESAVIVAEDGELLGELPAGAQLTAEVVQAVRLIVGQEWLEEPGEGPQGARLAGWLADSVAGKIPAVPEIVKPIYVRSPDADIHITKMKDPWGDLPTGPGRAGGR